MTTKTVQPLLNFIKKNWIPSCFSPQMQTNRLRFLVFVVSNYASDYKYLSIKKHVLCSFFLYSFMFLELCFSSLCCRSFVTLSHSTLPRTPLCLQCSRVTSAFSPNVNPNRLSTEGYSSSSQKRRQIFRYWGHCWTWLVCCHAHICQVVCRWQ